ncbi:MAG: hypothetical protein ACR2RE_00630, partial [Geminicoccaceae bacterium]
VAVAPGTTALLQGDGVDLFGVAGGDGAGDGALNDLADVNAAGAVNGDLLSFDGSVWGTAGSGILQRAMLPFRGALLERTSNLSISTNSYVPIPWQSQGYDTDAFWDVGQPTRLTVPSGVTKVRLTANIEWQSSPSAQLVQIRKNGGSVLGGGSVIIRGDGGYSNQMRNLISAVLPVIAGDWFELALYIGSSGELKSDHRTWFAVEVVETQDAANPPYDFSWSKEGQLGASEVVFRQVLARRVRLEAEFAGSVGVAGTAATADADFDVQRNGSTIGTIRFGAASTSATFIAATSVTLERGNELTVIAPASADVSLADPAVSVSGSLIS